MLAKIRERTQGIIATFVLVLVAIPFALFGINSYFEGNSSAPVAEVNGVEISEQAYRQRMQELQGINPQALQNPALRRMVLDGIIDQTLLLEHAEASGYRTSDEQLARMIRELPYFQRDGRFEPGLYEALVGQQGMRTVDFEARLRRDNLATQLQQGLTESAFVTDAEIEAILRLLRQERRVSYAVIKADALAPNIKIADQEVEDYYQANQESFRTPEAVRAEYLTLRARDIGQQIKPSEEDLRRVYEAEAARYVTPESRRVSHILIELPSGADEGTVAAARTRADELLKQARGDADFAALAKKHSNDAESAPKGGDLGTIAPGVLPAELESAAYKLKPQEVSEPVRTSYGFHLVKLTGYTPEKRRPYDSVKEELIELARKREAEERFYELVERFRNVVYEQPQGLQAAAKDLGLRVESSGWFTRAGGEGVLAKPEVVSAIFEEPEVLSGERNTDAIEVDAETMIALHVVERRPTAIRPLEEVRADIERALRQQRALEQARAIAEEWVQKLQAGRNLTELGREPGVALTSSKTVTREQSVGLNPQLLDAVFTAPRPDAKAVVGQVALGREGFAVYAIEAVKEGDPAKADDALKTRVRQQILQRRGADYYASYRAGLREVADVVINADRL